jgi:hypothetical protein
MVSATASYGDSLFWLAILQGSFTVLSVSVYGAWRYLIQGQRQRTAERLAREIRPGVEVKVDDHQNFLQIRSHTATRTDAGGPPPEQEGGQLLADIIWLDARREARPNDSGWAPPA